MSVELPHSRPAWAIQFRGNAVQLLFVLAVALVQGVLYLMLLPPWQHFDEPTHFEYAWLVANGSFRPSDADIDLSMRREVATSMLVHGFYRGLPQPDLDQQDATKIWIGVSQLGKSPLYYAVVGLPLMLMHGSDITTQLYAARVMSLLMFVLTILIVHGIMRDLTAPGHVFRWLIPVVVALVPPFADLMTGVNSDVGAVTAFTLFIWGMVRTIRLGFTLPRIVWIVLTTLVCAVVKDTTLIAVVIAPIGLVLAFWVQRQWRWRILVAGCGVAAVIGIVALIGWGDARSWYRWQGWDQPATTRSTRPDAVLGSHAVTIQAARGPMHQLLNRVPTADVAQLAGQTISVGGWLWSERPETRVELGVVWSEQGTMNLEVLAVPVDVTTTPTFYAHTVTVPEEADKLYFALIARRPVEGAKPALVYLDGAVLIQGEHNAQTPPTFDDDDASKGIWNGQAFTNPLRNASGESAGPRLRPWFAALVPRMINFERLWVAAPLFDLGLVVPFAFRTATEWVLYGLFARFSWGQIVLPGFIAPLLFQIWALVAVVGAVMWWVRSTPLANLRPALAFFTIAALGAWVSVSLWPLSYVLMSRVPLPSSRYTFPVILPTMLILTGGWWALWPRRLRFVGIGLLIAFMLLLNTLAVITIWSYYRDVV